MPLDYHAVRQNMVESQVRVNDVPDVAIQTAMRTVPREKFCGGAVHLAYADNEVEYAPGLYLLRPRDMGKLLQAIRPREGEKALAIAAPYGAAVLRAMGLKVDEAAAHDAVSGAYDVILCEGAVYATPQAWIDALAVGGRLGVVEREDAVGRAKIYLRTVEGVGSRIAFDAAAPVLAGFEKPTTFAF